MSTRRALRSSQSRRNPGSTRQARQLSERIKHNNACSSDHRSSQPRVNIYIPPKQRREIVEIKQFGCETFLIVKHSDSKHSERPSRLDATATFSAPAGIAHSSPGFLKTTSSRNHSGALQQPCQMQNHSGPPLNFTAVLIRLPRLRT